MSEDNTTQTEETQVNTPSTEASQNNVNEGMIPRSRFNEVNEKYKTLEAELSKFKKQQEADRLKALEEQGKYKTIAEETQAKLDEALPQVEEFKEYKQNKRNSLLSKVTDENDKLIANSLPLDKLELFVGKLTKTQNLPTNTVRAGTSKMSDKPYSEMTEAERKQWHQQTLNSRR